MSIITKSLYSDIDKEILYDEYCFMKRTVLSYAPNTPYYVYALCYPTGEPFYFGKGKDLRAFHHIKLFVTGKLNKRLKRTFDELIEPPIMFIVSGNLSEKDSLLLEKEYISSYGRKHLGGSLDNFMPDGIYSNSKLSSEAGTIGGTITRSKKIGIFSSTWDRSSETKSNWEAGLFDHIDFSSNGRKAGEACRDKKSGIHDPQYADMRSVWAKNAADALQKSGNRKGCTTVEWRQENLNQFIDNCSEAGKIGGKITGSKFWWNNGTKNVKSFECPDGFVRGMLMSDRKRNSLFGRKCNE